jgi:integral membrane sensor domain MASE1
MRAFAPHNVSLFAILSISYFVTGKFGAQLATLNPDATALWLPAGISLAAFLLKGNRAWPGIFAGAFLINATTHGPASIPVALGMALGNTLQAFIGAYLVNKFAHGTNAFFRARDVLGFLFLGGMLPCTLSATFGVGLLCRAGFASWDAFWQVWSLWWVGDVLGAVLLAPFLVLLLGHKHHSLDLPELLEITALLTGLSIVCVANFGPINAEWMPKSGFIYLCFPFLVWAALRFCPLEAAGATLLVSGFALWGSLHGFGLYANTASAPFSVFTYLAVASLMTMMAAAANVQQKQTSEEVLGMYYSLKETKDGEIRELRDTVEALQLELADIAVRGTRAASEGPGQ